MNENYIGSSFSSKNHIRKEENSCDCKLKTIDHLVRYAMSFRSLKSSSLGWIDCFLN